MVQQAPPDTLVTHFRMRAVACNLCGCDESVEVYPSTLPAPADLVDLYACTSSAYGLCGAIVRCVRCGHVFQNPQPVPEDLLQVYQQVVDDRYDQEREGRIHTFRHSLTELERHTQPGPLLDVGAHLGFFVEVAREAGWDAEGIEPSRWAAATAAGRGLPVRCASLEDFFPERLYHAVTLWDVIEHLPDPTASLWRIHGLLEPQGVLALSTMDVEAPVARLLGRRWPWYMQMHLHYFSRASLRRLVERCGFDLLEIRRHRRIVRVAYLVSRLEGRLGRLAGLAQSAVHRLGLANRLVGIDLGDIVTLYARKRAAEPWLPPSSNGARP